MTAGKHVYALGAGVLLVFGGIVAAGLVISARSGIPKDPLAAPCPPPDNVGGDGLRSRNPAELVSGQPLGATICQYRETTDPDNATSVKRTR